MGGFDIEFLRQYISAEEYKIAIETGSLKGDSSFLMSKIFEKVHTIEINELLFKLVEKRFKDTNVITHFGNSAELLPKIIETIDKPVLFYLDAHWSGDATIEWGKSRWTGYRTQNGIIINTGYIKSDEPSLEITSKQQVPLEEEMMAIYILCKHKTVIYIDDLDKFDVDGKGKIDQGFKGERWDSINIAVIMDKMKDRIENVYDYYSEEAGCITQRLIILKEII